MSHLPSNTPQSSEWTVNPVLAEKIYLAMSGGVTHKHWLNWIMDDYFAGKSFQRMLSPGCGGGAHEVIAAQSKKIGKIDAFDASEDYLKEARKAASQAGVEVNFYRDDFNAFRLPKASIYDLVLCSGSLHHVRELEHFLDQVVYGLKPEGYLVVNEYVGDCYNIYGQRQLNIINRLLACFADSLISKPQAIAQNPSIQDCIASDPSESVRSKLIPAFLRSYFEIEIEHPFGGAILHSLYPFLNHQEFTSRQPALDTLLRLLYEFERILMDGDVLPSDFVLYICRPKHR